MSSSDDDDNPEISGSDTDGSGEDLPPVKPATPPPKLDAKAARKAKKREHLVFEREEDAFPHRRLDRQLPPIDLRMNLTRAELEAEKRVRTIRYDEQYRISHYANDMQFPHVTELENKHGSTGLKDFQHAHKGKGCGCQWLCCPCWCWAMSCLWLLSECRRSEICCCRHQDVVPTADTDIVERRGSHVLVHHSQPKARPYEESESYLQELKDDIGLDVLECRKKAMKILKDVELADAQNA